MSVPQVRVAIVGCGHAGLCVVGALRRRNIDSVVFDDASRLGDVWRGRYDELTLNTERDASLIPDVDAPPSMDRWPTRDQWAAYIEHAADVLCVDRRVARVEQIQRGDGAWMLQTSAGDFCADAVVVATGRAHIPVIPEWLQNVGDSIEVIHSSRFRRANDYTGRRALVIGSGNSGAEIAHLLADGGVEVTWSIRTRPVWARRELFGTNLTTLGRMGKRLPDHLVDLSGRLSQPLLFGRLRPYGLGPPQRRLSQVAEASGATLDSGVIDDVRSGRVRLVGDVDGLDVDAAGSAVRLTNGTVIACDVVIAATGFRPGLKGVLPAEMLDESWPRVGQAPFEQTPGLFTAGLNPATLTAFHPDFITEAELIADAIAARQ